MRAKDENLSQYFIALVPPGPAYDMAMELKNYFRDNFASKASLNSPPHITLHMPFKWKEEKEQIMINALKSFAASQKPIAIELADFGTFAPRVIYIAVGKNEALISLQKELMRFCKRELNLFNADYRNLPFHPHITLAFRDLKKPAHAKAWEEFQSRKLAEKFTTQNMTLLKHDGKVWKPYVELGFGS